MSSSGKGRDRKKDKKAYVLDEALSTFVGFSLGRDDVAQEVHAQRARSSVLTVEDVIANVFDRALITRSMNMEWWDGKVRSEDFGTQRIRKEENKFEATARERRVMSQATAEVETEKHTGVYVERERGGGSVHMYVSKVRRV